MSYISGRIYIGDRHDAHNDEWLQHHKIRAVLNCSEELPNNSKHFFSLDKSKRLYLKLPMKDDKREDIQHCMIRAVDFIKEAVKVGNVLVHCSAGISRSVSMVMAYLICVKKKTCKDAYVHIQRKRDIAYPNSGYRAQLQNLEKHGCPKLVS